MRRPSAAVVVTGLLFGLPLVALVVRAFADVWRAPALLPQRWGGRGFDAAFAGDDALPALLASLGAGAVTTLLALVIAWPAARVLGERRLRHPALIFMLLAMPLLVPPYAVGLGLTEWFLRLEVTGTAASLVLAHLTVVLPYTVLLLLRR